MKSARARNKIRHWFSKERREAAAETGKAAIARTMRKQGLPLQRLATGRRAAADRPGPALHGRSALYAAVGESHVSAQNVVGKLINSAGGIAGAQEDLDEATLPARRSARPQAPGGDSGVVVEGADDIWARLSKCCTPVPGDQITGFVTRGNGVSVHRSDCVNLEHLLQSEPERMVGVRWSPKEGSQFLVAIQVEALDRTGLLSDVTRTLSDQHVNILSATVTTTRDRVAFSKFTFEMGDPKHLGHVLRAVRNIDARLRRLPRHELAPARRALTAELGQGALGFGEPGLAGGQGLLGALLGAGVAAGLGLGQLVLQLADGRPDLVDRAAGAGQRLGVGPPPVRVLGLAQRLLDLAQAALEPVGESRGDCPGALPALLDAAQRGAGRRGRRSPAAASPPRPAAAPWRSRSAAARRRGRSAPAERAWKNVSWAPLNRAHSSSSVARSARPACFHSRISSR